ncbi:MAG: DUF1028 domain-containing protein [Bacillota bacterium]
MRKLIATFSIVACDLAAGEWGVGTQSKFLGVGTAVPWARADAGAVATQAWANTSFGPRGLDLMAAGKSAQETLDELVASDPGRDHRQLGLVDLRGHAAAYTGSQCLDWAGHVVGPGFCCQGNILVSRDTVEAMAEAFTGTTGALADRLVASLRAGQAAGGDRRGRQSAALYIVKDKGGYGGYNDRYCDLRVDDHPEPIEELARLLDLHKLYFLKPPVIERIKVEGEVCRFLQEILRASGDYQGDINGILDVATQQALRDFHHRENFEEKYEEGYVAGEVYRYIRRYGVRK